MSNPTYSLKLTGPGLSLERTLTETEVGSIILHLFSAASKAGSPTPASGVPVPSHADRFELSQEDQQTNSSISRPHKTARGYLQEFEPKRIPDKIACLGLFLREIEKRNEFTREDIKRVFQAAAEPIPTNLGRDMQWTHSVDWISPSPSDSNLYYLTHNGESAVRAKFAKAVTEKTRLRQPTMRRKNGKTVSTEENPQPAGPPPPAA